MDGNENDSTALEEYAIEEVMRQFRGGNTLISATKLPEFMSNKIYKGLSLERVDFTHEQTETLKQSLTITKAAWNGAKFLGPVNELEKDLLSTQQLEELTLVEVRHERDVYLTSILKQLLKSSKASLRTLIIEATAPEFEKRWVRVLHKIAPKITKFDFEGIEIHNKDFMDLTSFFPSLVRLSLDNIELKSLKSISKLKDLTSLSLIRINFAHEKDLVEIFKLKHLQELDISHEIDERANTLGLYLRCKQVLPELRFIDCSHNRITEKMLNTLIGSHEQLKTVSIIGTRLDETPLTPERGVQLLSVVDLLSTMATARFYARKKNLPHRLLRIITKLNEFLENHFNEGGPSLWDNPDVSGCFVDLFNFVMLSDENVPTNQDWPFICFELFQRDPSFRLSRRQANQLIRHMNCVRRQRDFVQREHPSLFCKILTKHSVVGQATVSNKSTIRSLLVDYFMSPFSVEDFHGDRYCAVRDMRRVCIEQGELCDEVFSCSGFHLRVTYILRVIYLETRNDAIQIPPFRDYRGIIEILVKLSQTPEKYCLPLETDYKDLTLYALTQLLLLPDLDFDAVRYILKTIRYFLCTWNQNFSRLINTVASRRALLNIRNREFERAESLEIERLLYSNLMAIHQRSAANYRMEVTEEWLDMHSHQFMPFMEAHPQRQGNHVGIWRRAARRFSRNPFLHDWTNWMRTLIKTLNRS